MSGIDIAVVGGGPAGTYAAWSLARAGASVALFDPSHPREKPCGGGLTGRALALLPVPVDRPEICGVAVRALRFQTGPFDRARAARVAFEGGETAAPLVVTSRQALDGALLAAATSAGARLVPERVVGVEVAAHGVSLRTRDRVHAARFVLGADGVTSLVRRRLLGPFSRAQLSLAVGYYARGVSSSEVLIHCLADPPGYLWSFPRSDHLAIGACAPAAPGTRPKLGAAAAAWVRHEGLGPGPAVKGYSWPIPSLSPRDCATQRPGGDRWMLLGDAAGLVDPLTREGIYFALESGRLASAALAASRPPGAEYVTRLNDEIFPELRRSASLKGDFFTSRFPDLLVEALARSAEIRSVMRDLVAGRQPYRSLRRRLLGTLEFGLAARLLLLQWKG
jgi:geranylgeranyl reductase family protein